MINEYQIRVEPHNAVNEQAIKRYIAQAKGFDARTIKGIRVLRRSIDARQRTIYVNLTIRVFINEEPPANEYVSREYGNVENQRKVIVVGAGPAGLFAALKLIELRLQSSYNIFELSVSMLFKNSSKNISLLWSFTSSSTTV
ncbi:MAG: hypothetical protein IKZ18_06825, partial [Bacteroidaceae bacterium]|nr:hypothetical protein [Bacteroidaceae bacterium]